MHLTLNQRYNCWHLAHNCLPFASHCAQAPEICALYALDVPPSTLRAKFRTQFEKNKTVKDLAVLDLMLLKAQQEYQETMNGWKQIPHIMKWFAEEEVSCNDARSSLAAPAISTADLGGCAPE